MVSNKIYLVLFVGIFLLVVGEIIYFLVFLSPNKTGQNNLFNIPKEKADQKSTNQPSTRNPGQQAIHDTTLGTLQQLKKTITKSSIIINTYEGEVANLDIAEENDTEKEYRVKFRLQNASGVGNTFSLTDYDLQNTKFVQKNNDSESEYSLNNIKNGDIINMRTTLDLTSYEYPTVTENIITAL